MALRDIITAPDPRLRVKSKPVTAVTAALRRLMDDMLETMYAAPGVGLAAIQVGEPLAVIVMDLSKDDELRSPRFFVNPRILWSSQATSIYEEGCLSVPEFYEDVTRPARIRVSYLDYHGKALEADMDGMLATCLQHEMDHLEGILFIDHISRLKREMIVRKLEKAKKLARNPG